MITKDDVLRAVKLFRWVTRGVLVLYFGGDEGRLKALEILLPELEREGRIFSEWHRGEKVYSIARKDKVLPVSIDHEIACAEILVRLWLCRKEEGEIFTESAFRGSGIVPEASIRYPEKRNTMLGFEYCTRSNFLHGGVMKSKLTRYKKYLSDMEEKVKRKMMILFVIDVERSQVSDFVVRMHAILNEPVFSPITRESRYPFRFTDYQTFKSVPVGNTLKAKIYFWRDRREWALSND